MRVSSFEEELARSGRLVYTNVGVSMRPLLREGRDVMVIERKDTYQPYDAVLFVRPGVEGRGKYVLHRILRRLSADSCWIVGDNCTEGEVVRDENILGALTAVLRDGKTVTVDSARYRLYVLLWCRPYRLRFAVLRLRALAGRFLHLLRRLIQ